MLWLAACTAPPLDTPPAVRGEFVGVEEVEYASGDLVVRWTSEGPDSTYRVLLSGPEERELTVQGDELTVEGLPQGVYEVSVLGGDDVAPSVRQLVADNRLLRRGGLRVMPWFAVAGATERVAGLRRGSEGTVELELLSLGEDGEMALLATTDLPEGSRDLVLTEDLVIVAVQSWNDLLGLVILDIEDLSLMAALEFDPTHTLEVDGEVLYAGSTSGVWALDISDPKAPVPLRQWVRNGARIHDLCLHEGRLGVAWTWGVSVLDAESLESLAEHEDTTADLHSVALDGQVLVTADETEGGDVVLWTPDLEPGAWVRETEDVVHDLLLDRGALLLNAHEGGVEAWELLDPDQPERVGSYGANAQRLAAAGELVVVADGDEGVVALEYFPRVVRP